jgi:hypothetical protein
MDFAKISRTIIRFLESDFQTGIYNHSDCGDSYNGFARLMLKGQQHGYPNEPGCQNDRSAQKSLWELGFRPFVDNEKKPPVSEGLFKKELVFCDFYFTPNFLSVASSVFPVAGSPLAF